MKRSRHILKAPLSIGHILEESPLGRRASRLVDVYRVQKKWGEIVGEALARRTFPKRTRGDVLIVSAENPAWAQHLTLMKSEVLKVITERTGLSFADLKFVTEMIPKSGVRFF